MEHENFDRPVPIFVGMGYLTHVESVSRAHALLCDWPVSLRGPLHAAALRACRAAMAGQIEARAARRAFESFAESRHILARDAGLLAAASPRPGAARASSG